MVAPLTHLLERLRRIQPPPGAAASIVAVPSPGDELTQEVAGLFPGLDEIARRANALIAEARSAAAETEASAVGERRRILEAAEAEADRAAAVILAARRASCERQAAAMLADAAREVERVRAGGRRRTSALVTAVVGRLLAGGR